MSIVSEDMVHDAFDYLNHQGDAAAKAKGALVRADFYRRRIRAKLILEAKQPSLGLREAWAEAHDEYKEICEKLAECEEEVERHRNARSRAEAIIEMYRTESATRRTLGRVA